VDRGDCLPGFRCDERTETCVPACTSDEMCRLLGDGFVFTSVTAEASCDLFSGRCVHMAAASVPLGSPCASDLDCATRDVCHRPAELGGAGLCSRYACDRAGFECEGDARCVRVDADSLCLARCDGDHPCAGRLECTGAGPVCRPPALEADAGLAPDGGELDGGELDAGELTCASSAECAAGSICQTELGCTSDCFCVP
jgi:hypothetical protein